MLLTHLALSNFRNYPRLEIDFAPGITLLHGNNAQGKTNLLEAIFFLATARSPHAGAERELIHFGAADEPIPFARVQAKLARANAQTVELEIVLVTGAEREGATARGNAFARVSKRIKVNGVNKRALELLGNLNVVLFLPEDLEIVFGAPGDRRRYLDTTLAQIDPKYSRALLQFNQVIEQRNALLKEFRERSFNAAELEPWNNKLVENGAYIMARRAQAVATYNQLLAEIHPRLTADHKTLTLHYQPTIPLDTFAPAAARQLGLGISAPMASLEQISAAFKQQLAELQTKEVGAALTLVGPHRDDLRFTIDGVDMTTYASRGQGRTIAVALKLAEIELMRAETSEEPVLLLDDVMSELDKPRRAALSHALLNARQAIVSATDLDDFTDEFLARAKVLEVTAGKIGAVAAKVEMPEEENADASAVPF
ncbi:MAG: DNA replication/repair protein RecF [Chloroflexi bacterium UTCFX4]|jgi:DNA replication and repair protein RecF|nr:MAG: DNA replication/repair protein RecF [Chloroflexi bacterium UTCFX4]